MKRVKKNSKKAYGKKALVDEESNQVLNQVLMDNFLNFDIEIQ